MWTCLKLLQNVSTALTNSPTLQSFLEYLNISPRIIEIIFNQTCPSPDSPDMYALQLLRLDYYLVSLGVMPTDFMRLLENPVCSSSTVFNMMKKAFKAVQETLTVSGTDTFCRYANREGENDECSGTKSTIPRRGSCFSLQFQLTTYATVSLAKWAYVRLILIHSRPNHWTTLLRGATWVATL